MVQSLLHRDIFQALPAAAEEGAAGGREEDALEPPRGRGALQALEDGGVLTVHRQDTDAVLAGGLGDQLTAGDQGLLVGEGDGLPRLDGVHGGHESRNADDGIEDGIGLRVGGTFADAADAGEDFRSGVRDADPEVCRGGLVEQRDLVRVELADLVFQRVHAGAGGQGADADALFAADVQALGADGTGGAEDAEVLCHAPITTDP